MDLEIRYENGSMTVHLEEFLSERRIAKVRKLLKVIRSSFTPECEQQMKEFIQEQTEQFEQVQKEHSIYIEGYTQKVKSYFGDRKGGSPLSCKIHLSPGMVVISLVVISSRPSRCIFWL